MATSGLGIHTKGQRCLCVLLGRREFYIIGMFIDINVMPYTYVMLCDIFMYALFNELVYKYSHHDTCAG